MCVSICTQPPFPAPVLYLFKDETYLLYIRTQCVPRSKHSILVIKKQSVNVV
jgi:hypothetical protein